MRQPQPIILIDTREQWPLDITAFATEEASLPVGDYGVKGFSDWDRPDFIIERKEISDLCAAMGRSRARFLREVQKMRQFGFRALVIEGTRRQVEDGDYRSKILPASIFGTLDALSVRTGLHVFWCGSHEGAARQVETLAATFARGIYKSWEALRKAERTD